MRNYYVPGNWNALCDVCGFKHKASELRKNWKGQMVCKEDFETRHPQDLIRVSKERISTDWARPEPTNTFVTYPEALITETSATFIGSSPEYVVMENGSLILMEN